MTKDCNVTENDDCGGSANTLDADTPCGDNFSRACRKGGMGPSASGDLKTTGSEVSPTKFAVVRGEIKDVGLLLGFLPIDEELHREKKR